MSNLYLVRRSLAVTYDCEIPLGSVLDQFQVSRPPILYCFKCYTIRSLTHCDTSTVHLAAQVCGPPPCLYVSCCVFLPLATPTRPYGHQDREYSNELYSKARLRYSSSEMVFYSVRWPYGAGLMAVNTPLPPLPNQTGISNHATGRSRLSRRCADHQLQKSLMLLCVRILQ